MLFITLISNSSVTHNNNQYEIEEIEQCMMIPDKIQLLVIIL